MNKLIFIFFLTFNSNFIFAQESNIEDLSNRVSELEKQLSDSMGKSNSFNPAISVILDGSYKNYSLDPSNYSIAGFLGSSHAHGHGDEETTTETALGTNGFSLGHSELMLSGNIDPNHMGRITLGIHDDSLEMKKHCTNTGLASGLNVTVGRILPAIGYLNEQHRHTWISQTLLLINILG